MRAEAYRPILPAVLAPTSRLARYASMALLVVGGSIFTALCAQFSIRLPFTPVPITGQTFAVLTVGGLLGSRLGAAALLLYMLEGSAGLLWGDKGDGFKVFASGTNGWEIIAGPTGGYIIGFIAAAYVTGWLAERGFDRRPWSMALAMAVGNVVIYVFGLPWLDHFFPGKALEFGLYPFVPGDAAKLLLAASLLPLGRSALAKVPAIDEALPQPQEGLVLGRYVPVNLLYGALGLLVIIGAVLPWGLPGGGDELGLTERPGQVALVAGIASLVAAALPRLSLCLIAAALVVLGVLLPLDVLPDAYKIDVQQKAGLVALSVGLVAVVALSVSALPQMSRPESRRTAQFVVGAVAGYACFFQIADVLEASDDFALTDLGAGLLIAALTSVMLVAVSLLDREVQAEGEEEGSGSGQAWWRRIGDRWRRRSG